MADGAQAVELARQQFPDAVIGAGEYRGQHWLELKRDHIVEVARWLRDDPQASYDYLIDATAVDWPDDPCRFEAVYHLYSYARNDRLRLKVRADEHGRVPSLSGVWKAADWNEREAFDMFGIEFEGHPDLRRILMPDDYTDFPLRKEFPLFRG